MVNSITNFTPSTEPASARGYGRAHRQLREQWRRKIKAGACPPCSRCGRPIFPSEAFHLDHEENREGWRGPAHSSCNVKAGAKKGNRIAARRKAARQEQGLPETRVWDLRGPQRSGGRVWSS